jgi:hypothetical protein
MASAATKSRRRMSNNLPQPSAGPGRQILLFGDSHAHAVQRAIAKREGKGKTTRVVAYRLLKDKKGVQVGDSSLEQFLERVRGAGPNDLVASMIGGNQHAVYSTIQHPQKFDFFNVERDPVDPTAGEFIPYRALKDVFAYGLRSGDGRSLEALRKATKARIVHIVPPPPKADNEHIIKYHETLFANDIAHYGVSPPMLRLKFWKLQTRILARICERLGIEILMPPKRAVDELGFLRPEFYAHDATHGNWLYGERVIRQLEKIHPLAAPDRVSP